MIYSIIPSIETFETYVRLGFYNINKYSIKLFGGSESESLNLFSELGLRIQIFIAFAYTYHYLNWFSKTSIIGWSKSLSKQKMIWILIIYLMSVGLYFYDYQTGLVTLFFLSFLHIVLEFPINFFTIKGIIQGIKPKL